MNDADIPTWSAPFIMAAINTKNVHRTNALTGLSYGRNFTYDEMMATGEGDDGEKRAKAAVNSSNMQRTLLGFAPTRALLKQFALPKPGQGPSKEERENGMFDVLFVGKTRGRPLDPHQRLWRERSGLRLHVKDDQRSRALLERHAPLHHARRHLHPRRRHGRRADRSPASTRRACASKSKMK